MLINTAKIGPTGGGAAFVILACLGTNAAVSAMAHSSAMPMGAILVGRHLDITPSTRTAGMITGAFPEYLGGAARSVLGEHGLGRLQQFASLRAGWDSATSKPLDLQSVFAFSRFFESTGLHPDGLAVFMSSRGNVVVNWLASDNQMIELEFSAMDGIYYFIESTSEEGVISNSDIGFSQLYRKISPAPVAA